MRRLVASVVLANASDALLDERCFRQTLRVVSELWRGFRSHCKVELAVLLEGFLLRTLRACSPQVLFFFFFFFFFLNLSFFVFFLKGFRCLFLLFLCVSFFLLLCFVVLAFLRSFFSSFFHALAYVDRGGSGFVRLLELKVDCYRPPCKTMLSPC